jgi:hypothetical protein
LTFMGIAALGCPGELARHSCNRILDLRDGRRIGKGTCR